jgi:hypothetical protein
MAAMILKTPMVADADVRPDAFVITTGRNSAATLTEFGRDAMFRCHSGTSDLLKAL